MSQSKYAELALVVLREEIERLERVESLAGQIVATLVANADRGEFDAMRNATSFRVMINRFRDELAELRRAGSKECCGG